MRAATSGIMDSDGLTSPTYTYQWIRVDGATESDISGATSSTYTPVAADLGKTIKVKVSFTDDASNAETLTSTATTAVTAAGTVNNPATGAPTITGTAQVGQTLTAATSGIMDSDGLATPGYTYQWIRVDGGTDANISGATSITYTLVAADLGKTIKVKVSFTDDASNAETLTSTATAAVTAAVTDDCAETTTTTCSVSLGSSVTGDIESNNDADYFSLALTSGVTYQIDAEGSDTSKGTLDDPFLYLRNAPGTELASNEDGGTGRNARIVWTATSTETGYVDVQDSSATNTGTYTLTVSVATVPDAIADLSATPGNTQVTLSWTAFDDGGSTITKFQYRQKTSGSYGSWMDISNSPSTVSHTVTGLTNATAYTFQVRAMNGVGNAGVSNEATATPGYAQSAANVTYVSNIGQGSDDDDSSSQVRAQTFTTGSRAGGYTVTSVDIGSDDAEGDSFTANLSITDPTSGNPVAKVATLTVPTSFTAGTLTFIAPPPYTVLEPNTTYSVTITVGSNNVTLDTTLSNREDSGRTSGWSIANTSHRVDGGDWAETTDGESIRIAINGPANPARGAPTITGTAQVGETLTAATSAISDADGLTSPVYTYQWIRVDGGTDAHITGATLITYVPVDADTGKTIRVRVRFTDDANYSEERTSAATAVVNAPATGEPTISGITQVGETLTAVPSLIMDANGLTSPGYTYQWIRVDGTDTDISGATSNTYTLGDADNGKPIKVRVRFTDDDGYSAERTSAATAAVSPPSPAGLLVSIAVEGDEQIIDQFIIGIGVPKAKFRVSIPAALTANLNVTINISEVSDTRTDLGNAQTADHVAAADEGNQTVTIAAGDTSAVHEVEVQRDETFEQDGVVRAEVAPGFGYRASASAPSADVRVLDTSQPYQIRALHSDGSPLTGGARLAHIRVDEGAGRVVVLYECVTLYDREPRRQRNLVFSATSQKVTAEFRNAEDYSSFAEQVRCTDEYDPTLGWTSTGLSSGQVVPPSATGFRRVQRDGRWIYQSVVTLVGRITDDQVYDPDETFRMALQRGPNLPNYVERINTAIPGVSSSSSSSHLVTILDDARPPANLEATVGGVDVGLTWDELPGDRAVQTYEVKVNDGPWRALDTGPRTHSWIGGLSPGVENTITVGARYWGPERPRWGRGDCEVFNCSVTVMGPMLDTAHADGPGAVTGLAVSRMNLGEAKLSWTPPSDPGAFGIYGYEWRATGGSFDVEPEFLNQWHDTAPSADGSSMDDHGNTTSAIINWLEGVDHTIYVRAWSGRSKYPGPVASVTLTGTGANQPTNLRATAVADTWVTLSWTAPSVRPETVDSYHVETRDPFTDNQWSYGGEGTGGNGTTYTVEGLEPGVPYIFRVRGRSESLGLFTPSDYFARGTLRAGSPALALVHVVYPPGATSLFASANGGSRIDLGWITTNPASTSYDLEWSADGETGWQAVDPDDDGADTTYGHTGLTAGTTYYYRVRGVNGDGPGPWALAAATTSALAPREAQAANTPAKGAPSISGTAQVGETLTAVTSDIADADGLAKAAFSYQWQAAGADISGATASTYTLADADIGAAISVTVSFTDDAGNEESLTSAATAAVAAADPQEAQGAAGDDAAEPTDRPHGLTAEASDGAVVLTWTAPVVDYQVSSYHILRHRPEQGEAEPLVYVDQTPNKDTSYTDTEVEPGVLYVYRVKAIVNWMGDLGDASDAAQIRVQATAQEQTANNPATGAPTITGTAQVGETLRADASGIGDADGLSNAALAYQWLADGAEISGATGAAYTLAATDEGKAITVQVSFSDDAGNAESLTSAATAAVEAAADPHAPQEAQGAAGDDAPEPTDRPHGLTAEASGGAVVLTWKAPEGYRSDYRILRNRPELGEAEPLVYVAYTDTTDVTYTDTDVEPGVLYVYSVTALDFLGDAGEASRPVEIRMQATSQQQTANSPATGAPAITGTAQVGETLTADTSGVADADGLSNAVFSYQWLAGGAEISSATGSSYTLVDSDEGKAVSVTVSFTDDTGNAETLTSAATTAVKAIPNSPATGAPAIGGTAQVGETLTADTSGIADDDGLDNASFSYQWQADGADIAGATGSTYTLVDADEGKAISVAVSFTDDAGNAETLTSAATDAVDGAPSTPLTASVENVAASHDGESVFTFELRFSEEFGISYKTLRDHAFTVTGGTVKKAQRLEQGSNIGGRITVSPDSSGAVTITLPITEDCDAQGAICTEDGRMLSHRLELTVSGP